MAGCFLCTEDRAGSTWSCTACGGRAHSWCMGVALKSRCACPKCARVLGADEVKRIDEQVSDDSSRNWAKIMERYRVLTS